MGNCIAAKKSASPGVIVSAAVWKRSEKNEQECFLESIPSINHSIMSPCKILQTQSGLTIKNAHNINNEFLLSIGYANGRYWAYRNTKDEIEEPMWVVLPNTLPEKLLQSFKLHTNDVFKIGRYKITVKEIVREKVKVLKEKNGRCSTQPGIGDVEQMKNDDVIPLCKELCKKSANELQCRICLESKSAENDPLIESPCKCTGTVKLIHQNCLKKWLRGQVVIKDTKFVQTYQWKKFKCDVCKQPYPEQMRFANGRCLEIVEIDQPGSNYIVLETLAHKETEDKCNLWCDG